MILSFSDLKISAIAKSAAVLVVVFQSTSVFLFLSFFKFCFQVDHLFKSIKVYSELAYALGKRKAMAACFTFEMLFFFGNKTSNDSMNRTIYKDTGSYHCFCYR